MLFKYFLIYIVVFFGIFVGTFLLLTLIENWRRIKNPMPMRFPSVSIIIPAYNEESNIAKTISSAARMNYPKDKLEILVVDDGSKDKTLEVAKTAARSCHSKYGIKVKVFTKKNGGKATAINFGIKHVKGEIIGTLDADSFPEKDALMKMIGYLENDKVASVTSSLKAVSYTHLTLPTIYSV